MLPVTRATLLLVSLFSAESIATISPPDTITFFASIFDLLVESETTLILPADFTVASLISATVSEELVYASEPPENPIPLTPTSTPVISTFDVFFAFTETLPVVLSVFPPVIPENVFDAKSTSLTPTLPPPKPAVTVTFVSERLTFSPLPFILDSALIFISPDVFRFPFTLEIAPVSVTVGSGSGVYFSFCSTLSITTFILLSSSF